MDRALVTGFHGPFQGFCSFSTRAITCDNNRSLAAKERDRCASETARRPCHEHNVAFKRPVGEIEIEALG
jgi:hypothetical protein